MDLYKYSIYLYNNLNIGYYVQTPSFFIFFGNKNLDTENLSLAFPQYQFSLLKQVHGNHVVSGSSDLHEADGHYTSVVQNALTLVTADCLPLLIYDPEQSKVAALHAGWRGVQKNIVNSLLNTSRFSKSTLVFVGPHIQQESFEVDQDVASLFSEKNKTYYAAKNKYYVSLINEVRDQFSEFGINTFYPLHINTFTDSDFYSFRRDKQGRQFSFITLL